MSSSLAMVSHVQSIAAIEVACGAGALDSRCRNGPRAFRRASETALSSRGIALDWQLMPEKLCTADLSPLEAVSRTGHWTAYHTRTLAADGDRFVVIGGDHSCAIGTWIGAADGLRGSGSLGLIWIDAHMDMHVPETTHSGAIHGMPVACLLGYGASMLTSIAETGPAIDPRHICLVGTRSFEEEEAAFAQRHGVHVIHMDEVRQRGICAVLAEARSIVTNGTAGYGISLDLDAFDPSDAPGVGTPSPNGIRADAFFAPWSELGRDPRCIGIEIVEYNPSRDFSRHTAHLMCDLISAWI